MYKIVNDVKCCDCGTKQGLIEVKQVKDKTSNFLVLCDECLDTREVFMKLNYQIIVNLLIVHIID